MGFSFPDSFEFPPKFLYITKIRRWNSSKNKRYFDESGLCGRKIDFMNFYATFEEIFHKHKIWMML
jgi:hypothetical protein